MAGVWEGFSEEDIGYYKKKTEETNEKITTKEKATNLQGVAKKNVVKEKTQKRVPTPEGAKPCKDDRETVPLVKKVERGKGRGGEEEDEEEGEEDEEARKKELGSSISGSSNPVRLKVIEGKAYELVSTKASAEASETTLKVFEARQKMLEEQNKRRKEMLAKVISARKKQTTEEAKRLQHIQEELQKLDLLLSNDVGILRNKIEEASLDFVEAQKRYNKAEKEFLAAKQDLFTKLEKKELLTKLLCTIIEQNEMRKAQKLSELMEKLKINENGIDGTSANNSVIISPDCHGALRETTVKAKETENEKSKQPS